MFATVCRNGGLGCTSVGLAAGATKPVNWKYCGVRWIGYWPAPADSKSILNRTSQTSLGALMLEYGAGGHENAGACQVSNDMAEDVLGALIRRITTEA